MLKKDPRTIRTKKMLKDALVQLIVTGEKIEKISIQKVTATAGLNRSTFYLHYADIYDLLTELMAEITAEIEEKVTRLIDAKKLSEKAQLIQFLDYLYTERDYVLVVFQQGDFEEKLFQAMRQIIEARRQKVVGESKKKSVDIDIKTASLTGIIVWWLQKGRHLSSEYIATEIYNMYR